MLTSFVVIYKLYIVANNFNRFSDPSHGMNDNSRLEKHSVIIEIFFWQIIITLRWKGTITHCMLTLKLYVACADVEIDGRKIGGGGGGWGGAHDPSW